jgi:hypothetical protein
MPENRTRLSWRLKHQRWQKSWWELWRGGQRLAVIAETTGGWYTYMSPLGNTASTPEASLYELKAKVVAAIREADKAKESK